MGDLLSKRNILGKIDISAEPAKIEVPESEYNKILVEMAAAFLGKRAGCETAESAKEYAKKILKEAIYGKKFDKNPLGTPIKKCPAKDAAQVKKMGWRAALNKRLRVYHYDLDKGFIGHERQSDEKPGQLAILSNELLTPDDEEKIERRVKELKEDFPELNSQTDEIGFRMIAYLEHQMKNIMVHNQPVPKDMMESYRQLTDSMGISGYRRKALKEKLDQGGIEELHQIYRETKKNYAKVEEEMMKEEVELLYQSMKNGEIEHTTMMAYLRLLGHNFQSDEEILKYIGKD